RPRDLLHALDRVQVSGHLGRGRRVPTAKAERSDDRACLGLSTAPGAGIRGAVARLLLVPVDVELVALGGLQRQPERADPPALGPERALRPVGLVGPLRRVAGVLVREHVGNAAVVALVPEGPVEPEAVAQDWPADAEV